MAPRSLESSFDYCGNSNKFGIAEFKPRVGTWATDNSWSSSSSRVDDDEVSSQQQQQRRRNRRRRQVRFASNPEIQDYLHRKDYTSEEKRSCWFRRSEYESMRTHNAATLDKLLRDIPLDQQNESIFGLEAHTHGVDYHDRCHQIIRCAILAVLEEQDDQRRYDGSINEHVLAARYVCCTGEARDRAISLGHFQSLLE